MHRSWEGRLAALFCLAAFLFLAAAIPARGEPLSPSSPLYNPGGSPIVNANPDVVVDYSGTIIETVDAPPVAGAKDSHFINAKLEWDETVAGPVDQIEYTGVYGASSIHWHVNKLTGTVKDRRTDSAGNETSCEGSFSPSSTDGGTGDVLVPLETPGHPAGGGNPATNPDYFVRRLMPVGLVISSAAPGNDELCTTQWWNGTGDASWGFVPSFAAGEAFTKWGEVVNPGVYFPVGGGHTAALNFEYTCTPGPSCGAGTGTGVPTIKVESSITFSSPGLGTGTPIVKGSGSAGGGTAGPLPPISCGPGSKPTCQEKKAAQEDLRSQLPGLANECAIATIGLGGLVVGAAAPEIGIASVLAAAGPTGAEIVALSGPVCGLLIKRIYDDAKIIEDPPIGGLHKLARPAKPRGAAAKLPSCKRFAANVRAYCAKLRADASRYAAAVRRSVAVDDALLITVDRVSGAFKAHNKGALALQKRQASSLRAQLASAHREQQRAGAAIIKLVRSVGLQASISASQQQQGITKAGSGLAKRGISAAQAQRLGGVTLTAAPSDALAQLGQ
jgi:hypothetical protein